MGRDFCCDKCVVVGRLWQGRHHVLCASKTLLLFGHRLHQSRARLSTQCGMRKVMPFHSLPLECMGRPGLAVLGRFLGFSPSECSVDTTRLGPCCCRRHLGDLQGRRVRCDQVCGAAPGRRAAAHAGSWRRDRPLLGHVPAAQQRAGGGPKAGPPLLAAALAWPCCCQGRAAFRARQPEHGERSQRRHATGRVAASPPASCSLFEPRPCPSPGSPRLSRPHGPGGNSSLPTCCMHGPRAAPSGHGTSSCPAFRCVLAHLQPPLTPRP